MSLRKSLLITSLLGFWTAIIGWELWNSGNALIYRDIPRMGLPNLQFLGQAVREGFIPFLDPHKGAGMPFLFDPQTGAWYPPCWLFALAGPERGFRLSQFFHLLWLGLGFATFSLTRGNGILSAILAGITAVGAFPFLRGLEWISLPAGFSWIPWAFLCAFLGYSRWCGVCLALAIFSGHAYLWVAMPLIALALLAQCPGESRKQLGLALVAVVFVTLPAWGGYLSLSSKMAAHGFDGNKEQPIIGFEPKHLAGLLFPKAFLPFTLRAADGKEISGNRSEKFAWTRDCYLGVFPIVLVLFFIYCHFTMSPIKSGSQIPASSFDPSYDPALHTRKSSLVLIMGGLFFSMGLPWAGSAGLSFFKHMYHPASFIFLTVFGLFILTSDGAELAFNNRDAAVATSMKSFSKGLLVAVIFFLACHFLLSQAALEGGVSAIWNHTFTTGGETYSLLFLIAGICFSVSRFAAREGNEPGRSKALSLGFLVILIIHVTDLNSHSFQAIPLSGTKGSAPESPLGNVPPTAGRILTTREIILGIKGISGVNSREEMEHFFALINGAGVPNVEAANGFSHLGDYNPPFSFPTREAWLARIQQSPTSERGVLFALSGVEFIVALEDFIPEEYWQLLGELPFGNLFTLKFWRNPVSYPATLLSPNDLEKLDQGGVPQKMLGLPYSTFSWSGTSCLVSLPEAIDKHSVLFIPVNNLAGWQAKVDGKPTAILPRRSFGVVFPVEPGSHQAELTYQEPWFGPFIAVSMLGWAGLLFLPLIGRDASVMGKQLRQELHAG